MNVREPSGPTTSWFSTPGSTSVREAAKRVRLPPSMGSCRELAPLSRRRRAVRRASRKRHRRKTWLQVNVALGPLPLRSVLLVMQKLKDMFSMQRKLCCQVLPLLMRGDDYMCVFVIFKLSFSLLCINSLFCVFQKAKMVLTDQKSDRKHAVTVPSPSGQAITSQFISGLTQVFTTHLA